MKFNLNFIKEFLDIGLKPEEVAEALTFAGMEVESLEKSGGDWIFSIEVTTNRYDWLSVIGITREISAVLGKKMKLKYPKISYPSRLKERDIIIENGKDCFYYTGRSIKGIRVEKNKLFDASLSGCGINTVNNVVDITNYCMLKWGNPLHAFDEDKLKGNVYIRRAKDKEEFKGIDAKARRLCPDNLVIADEEKVIALAGIMGSKDTEVNENTRNVFLEAAVFSPLAVRRSSRSAGLATESSYRFERMVCGLSLEYAAREAAELISLQARERVYGPAVSGKRPQESNKSISLDLRLLDEYMGIEFSPKKVESILKNLGFSVKKKKKSQLDVKAPFWRLDIKDRVDIYEEVGRIFGYNNIPSRLPFINRLSACDTRIHEKEDIFEFKNNLRRFMSLVSFKEIMTYSLEDSDELKFLRQKDAISLINPLRSQENCLRTTLLAGMAKCLRHNINHGQKGLKFFEIADTYHKREKSYIERPVLSIGISGEHEDAFHLKWAVEELLKYLDIKDYLIKEYSRDNFKNSLSIIIEEKDAGFIGKLDEEKRRHFGLKEELFFAEIDLKALYSSKKEKKYEAYSLYPEVWQDISIILAPEISFKEIEDIILKSGIYVKGLDIVDVYRGADIPAGSKAFTLRILYQAFDKTLTSQEIDLIHKKIRESIARKKGVSLR